MTGQHPDRTEEALRRLASELEVLHGRRKELSEGRGDDAVGDRVDASASLERSDDLALVEERIAAAEAQIHQVKAGTLPSAPGSLPDGAVVTLRYPDDDSTVTLRAVAIPEEIAEGEEAITLDSPLARALAGRSAGDKIDYQTPGGTVSAEIVSIEP